MSVVSVLPARARNEIAKRDWFLRDSSWDDVVWILAPTSKLEEEQPLRIRWNFLMPSGRCFTEPRYATLLETARTLVALIRTRSWISGRGRRASTVHNYFCYLRELLRWMDREGLARFADLDTTAILQYQRSIKERRGRKREALTPSSVQKYLNVLLDLHHYREEIGDGLPMHPFPGQSSSRVAGWRDSERGVLPYTPDAVAVPLIQCAIEFLSSSAIDILRAREKYLAATDDAQFLGSSEPTCHRLTVQALRRMTFHPVMEAPKAIHRIDSARELGELVDMLYAASFVVISYLVGPRASEILQLHAGCVQPLTASSSTNGVAASETGLAVVLGSIFKQEPDYHGRRHEWVAPQPVVHAITVLEALSSAHRARTGRKELWLRAAGRAFGATECRRAFNGRIEVPRSERIGYLLNRFGTWLSLPAHEGKRWHLTTHQGRKTFARFAALRDRSSLFALAQHLGHRERAITDHGYAGTDYALNREIDNEILEQSVGAWERMLCAASLGGRAGAEIVTKRPRFRGQRMKQDLKSYARMLVEAGLTLGICEWGFCVYRQEYSACFGNAAGPSPVRREPSTCARCKNFAVSEEHRPYWLEQARRYESLLNEPALPTQTLKIARERLSEALAMLRSIDGKEG